MKSVLAQPPGFHQRWMELSTIRGPSGDTIVESLGIPRGLSDNPFGGQSFRFDNGDLVSLNKESLPYVILGDIRTFWRRLGSVNSGWGRPLADEQGLPDGGRCSVMEGGHIHYKGGVVRGFVLSHAIIIAMSSKHLSFARAPAELCSAAIKPTAIALTFNEMVSRPLVHPHSHCRSLRIFIASSFPTKMVQACRRYKSSSAEIGRRMYV
jgi:hypothetical protein